MYNPFGCIIMGIYRPMRPKARGLAQHGGPPGWLKGSDPAGNDFEEEKKQRRSRISRRRRDK